MSFPGFLYEFANSPISVAFPSYLSLDLLTITSPTQLYWPSQNPYQPTPFSSNMFIITNDSTSNIIKLPDASIVSTSQSSILVNISANEAILNDYDGGYVGTITSTNVVAGLSYYLVLTSNISAAGSWTLIPFGTASLAPIDVQNLVDTQANTTNPDVSMQGGLAAILDTEVSTPGTYLKVNTLVQNIDSSVGTYTQTQGDRGTLLVVEGSSSLTYDLLSAFDAGNGYIFSINNTTPSTGGGAITLTTTVGDTIDVSTLNPSNSASFVSDGINKWTSLGFGLNTIPLNFVDVTVSLAAGSNTSPSLSFFNDVTGSLGLFYDSTSNSMQIVQSYFNPTANPVVIADFYTTDVETDGFVTLAGNSTFSGTTATLLGSTFSTSNVDLAATGTIDIVSSAGNINLTSATNNNINSGAIVSIIATDDVTITSSTADIDLTADVTVTITATDNIALIATTGYIDLTSDTTITITATDSINNVAPALQQEGISIYSLMRAYS